MFDTAAVSYTAAFFAGLLSFFTPCVLPLIPVYFTIITGLSLENLTQAETPDIRRRVFFSTAAYVLGFSAVFVTLGATASFLGALVGKNAAVLKIAGGVVVIALGIHTTGLVTIPWLGAEKRLHIKERPMTVAGAFLVGAVFAAGWTPCVGPILGSILIMASNQQTVGEGVLLLSLYSAGLAIPFLFLSLFINALLVFIKRANRAIKYVNMLAGVLLVGIGVFLIIG